MTQSVLLTLATVPIGLLLVTLISCARQDPRPEEAGSTHDERHRRKPLPSSEEIAMLPPDGGKEFNRLVHEKSPYLLQHARNPVDWYPWGPEAFAAAKERDVPVFLSVGYSTCHWCHVMAHESFEDVECARILNQDFVAIKVDREERPDIDEIYMNVTQMMTRHGGWPNSVWLTPDGRAFYAGTYFPPEDRGGLPGFKTTLRKITGWWKDQRDDVEKQADEITRSLREMAAGGHIESKGGLSRGLVDAALAELKKAFDWQHGGFGSRPKFPPHGSLALLLYESGRRAADGELIDMASRTLDAIRLGGIHDHVGGGFARYSTDDHWFLPHFEKMLYDNAQLARACVDAWRLTKNEAFRRTAERTYDWALREMRSPEGAFYSAYDADSDGEEGKFYLWRRDEVLQTLGATEGELICRIFGVTAEGNFREEATGHRPGTNILYLKAPLEKIAADEKMTPDALRKRVAASLEKLYEVRKTRIRPHLDDKVLASWNGLLIGSLAHAGKALGKPEYLGAAAAAATFVLEAMSKDGRLLRTWREGVAKLNAYLDDYVFLAHGLLDLHEATGETIWLQKAASLMTEVETHFADERSGGFFFTSDDHETLLTRSKDPFDKAIPSGNGMASLVLVRLARITGNLDHLTKARRCFDAFLGIMQRAPRASESMLLALARYYDEFTPEQRGEGVEPSAAATTTATADAVTVQGPVKVEAFVSRDCIAPGDSVLAAVRFTVDPGWHVNAHEPGLKHLTPTKVALAGGGALSLARIAYPSGKEFKPADGKDSFQVYENEAVVAASFRLAAGVKDGPVNLTLEVTFQACDDQRCLAPHKVKLALPLKVSAGAGEGELRHPAIFEKLDFK